MKLWQKDSYLTNEFDSLVSKNITEYDIREAGYNLTIYFRLLSQKKIDYLKTLDKEHRHIQIGLYQREDKDYCEKINASYGVARKMFLEDNHIDDSDILSIKKDAIFIIGKKCDITSYGNVNFIAKHTYTSFHKLGGLELYYSSRDNSLDIKGISDENLDQHKLFMSILKRSFNLIETGNIEGFMRFIRRFSYDYKNKNLKYDYYREFNSRGMISMTANEKDVYRYYLSNISDDSFDDMIDISYNYMNFILPLIQRFYDFKLK